MMADNLQIVASTVNADYFIQANPHGTWFAYRRATAQRIRQIGGHYFSEDEARKAVDKRAARDI